MEGKGYLFFESQASDILYGTWDQKYDLLKKYFEIVKEKNVPSKYPSNVKERTFLILKLK